MPTQSPESLSLRRWRYDIPRFAGTSKPPAAFLATRPKATDDDDDFFDTFFRSLEQSRTEREKRKPRLVARTENHLDWLEKGEFSTEAVPGFTVAENHLDWLKLDDTPQRDAAWMENDERDLVPAVTPNRWTRQQTRARAAELTLQWHEDEEKRLQLQAQHDRARQNAERDAIWLQMIALEMAVILARKEAEGLFAWLERDIRERRQEHARERSRDYGMER